MDNEQNILSFTHILITIIKKSSECQEIFLYKQTYGTTL